MAGTGHSRETWRNLILEKKFFNHVYGNGEPEGNWDKHCVIYHFQVALSGGSSAGTRTYFHLNYSW